MSLRARFLVVTDNAPDRHLIRGFLENGCGQAEVLTVTDGQRALEILQAVGGIGCIITGTKMSDSPGGLGLIELIRRSEAWQKLPILVIVEPGDEATKKLAASLGAPVSIEKPFDIVEFRRAVAELIAPRITDVVEYR